MSERGMLLQRDPLNLIIVGVGGQGSLLASQVLGQALVQQGLQVTIGETLGLSQRGGTVISQMRISCDRELSPLVAEGGGHLILALEPAEGLRALVRFGNPEICMLLNPRPIHPPGVIAGEAEYPPLEDLLAAARGLCRRLWVIKATELALGLGQARLANMVLLGALCGLKLVPADKEQMEEVLRYVLPPAHVQANLRAFDLGLAQARTETASES